MTASHLSLPLLLTLAACVPSDATRPAARYPALPAGPSASSEAPAFVPASELTAVRLACRPDEPELANALDDDCDGRVDQVAGSEPLVLTFAYPQQATPRLALEAEQTATRELLTPACEEASPFCTVQLPTSQLARGHYALSVQTAASNGDAAPLALVVSVQLHGKVTTYLATLDAHTEEQVLGQLALP